MAEKRLIDANALLEAVEQIPWWSDIEEVVERIKELPTVDAVEVVHGRWNAVFEYEDFQYAHCSVCGKRYEYMTKFCPNCGADMREVSDA